ncbi:uncharacterized protein [Montipora foliosa]|uniref:uncharacterized protein n=1 Tax=Montipora foliosa TaxID=591990 RepID=UPI0035F12A8D
MAANFDYIFKVLVLGDSSVGKSSLIRRFHADVFEQKLPTTIGVDFFVHDFEVDGKKVKLQIWDTAGEERYRQGGLTSSFYRGAHGALIVFSLTSHKSFENVKKLWIDEFYRKSGSDTVTILVGNKQDLEDKREVKEDHIKEFAELNSMCWLETSAKDCTNVKEAFDTMVYKLCESHEQYLSFQSEPSSPTSFTLHGAYGISDQQQSSGLGYCCNST